jgi:Lon protease-like protein
MASRGMPAAVRLPLFPLHTVLFPEATLALQIFEPRYREMIGRCLAHDETFGVVLILEGEEVGGEVIPRRFGTEAAIIASERSKDGRYDIVAEGRRRFEFVGLDKSRAYLRADVEFLDDPLGEDAELLADTVAHLVEGVVQALEAHGRVVVDETWNNLDPRSLSYHVATILPGAEDVRQELLEMRDVASRLRREAELLMSIHRVGIEAGAA